MSIKFTELNEINMAIGSEELPILSDGKLYKTKIDQLKFFNTEYEDVTIQGNFEVNVSETVVFTITNYNSFKNYIIEVQYGAVTINKELIIYTANNSIGIDVLTVNNNSFNIEIKELIVEKPTILVPVNNSVLDSTYFIATTSAYAASNYSSSTHAASEWEIALDANFNEIVLSEQKYRIVDNNYYVITSYQIENLLPNTIYYIRVRYVSNTNVYSQWSDTLTIDTGNAIIINTINESYILQQDNDGELGAFVDVSISGDGSRIAVGHPSYYHVMPMNGYFAGIVYVYVKTEFGWDLESTILNPILIVSYDHFGASVSFDNLANILVIGSYGDAYVFKRTNNSWSFEVALKSLSNYSQFVGFASYGTAVSISGDGTIIAIGDDYSSVSYSNGDLFEAVGVVFIYVLINNAWTEESRIYENADDLDPDNFYYSTEFGCSVKLNYDGSRLVAGARSTAFSAITSAGAAYVFSRSGNMWSQEAILTQAIKSSYKYFGSSVSMSNDGSRVAIGEYRARVSGLNYAGKVHIFIRSGNTWALETELISDSPIYYAEFGYSISISPSGNKVLVGERKSLSNLCGMAYLFELDQTQSWVLTKKLLTNDQYNNAYFGTAANCNDNTVAVSSGTSSVYNSLTYVYTI